MKPNQLRNLNKNTFIKLFLTGLGSIIIGFAGYAAIIYSFPFFSLSVSKEIDWSLLGTFVSVLSLALLVGSLAFALAEYIGNENAKNLEKLAEEREKAKLAYGIYQTIFEKLTMPEQEAARRWILSNITIRKEDENLDAWYEQTNAKIMSLSKAHQGDLPEGQKFVKLTLNCFDYIGFVADHYWDIEDDSLDWISVPIAKVWRRIGPYVMYVRKLRGSKDYYASAEYIGDLCVKWRQNRGFSDEIYAEKTL
jgi:hypothetical protein